MKFVIDKQTLEDLNLLGRYKNNSIYNVFNHTVTRGGGLVLERMFMNPLTSSQEINERREIFNFFGKNKFFFPVSKEEFEAAEHYLGNTDNKQLVVSIANNIRRKALSLIANDEEFTLLRNGISTAVLVLRKLDDFIRLLSKASASTVFQKSVERALSILNKKSLQWIFSNENPDSLSFIKFALYDHRLRYTVAESISELMKIIHEIDVFITVSEIGNSRGFVYAHAVDSDFSNIEIQGVYHPCIKGAVANDISLDSNSNVLFLTGANMAGKSTLMKSFGVSLYLAHMGFPIAAKSMRFSVQEGIYTSINVPDDLNMGYSHFYAEVVRVKKIALEVSSGKRLIVMFDELFKGTNVKDAYDATVAVTEAFSKIHRCSFIVSTHIMEAGLSLQASCSNIQFKYLPTIMNESTPVYPYILDDGISNDRHGMMIINNEKIIEIIKGS